MILGSTILIFVFYFVSHCKHDSRPLSEPRASRSLHQSEIHRNTTATNASIDSNNINRIAFSRMGFTILLKGSHSDELKKIKCVVQFAVVMAYHLILESSFLVNQRAMFSTTAPNGMTIFSNSNETKPVYIGLDDDNDDDEDDIPVTSTETDLITTIDIPIISNGFLEENGSDNLGLEGHSLSCYEPYDPIVL